MLKAMILIITIVISIDYIGLIVPSVEKCVNIDKTTECDVAFVGSSHVYRGINPQLIYDETGITSVNLASSSQDIKGSYWLLKSYLVKHHPQVVFVDLALRDAGARETYVLWNFHEYDPMKYQAYNELKNGDFTLSDSSRFLSFRDGYANITKSDFDYTHGEGALQSNRWYNAMYSKSTVLEWNDIKDLYRESMKFDAGEIRKYVDKIIDLSEHHNVKLVFINPPWALSHDADHFYKEMSEYLVSRNIDFLNYSDLNTGQSDFDLNTDFADYDHLSYEGGYKYTEKLCEYIVSDIKLTHNNLNPVDESWDKYREHYQYTYDILNMDTHSLSDYLKCTDTLPGNDYVQIITFDMEAYEKSKDNDKKALEKLGFNPNAKGNPFYIFVKSDNESISAQGEETVEKYMNIEGVSSYICRDSKKGYVRVGTNIQTSKPGEISTAVYVKSYNSILRQDIW